MVTETGHTLGRIGSRWSPSLLNKFSIFDIGRTVVVLLLCLLASGCTGEYNQRLTKTIETMKNQVHLYAAPSPVVDSSTGASLRLPEMIGGDAKTLQVGGEGSDEAQPPFVDLPGFAYAYQFDAFGNPAYLYVASVPVADKSVEDLASEIQQAVRKAFSSATWQETEVPTPDGAKLAIKRMSVVGPQKFGELDLNGRFDLYLASSVSHHVLLGWRAPAEAEKFFQAATASVGSLTGTNQ